MLAFACALLVSCSTGDESSDDISHSPSVSETESVDTTVEPTTSIPPRPQADPPAEPDLGDDPFRNAVAVAEYMAHAYVYANKTGDTSGWDKYSADECDYCVDMSANVAEMNETGAWVDGDLEVLDRAWGKVVGEADVYGVHLLVSRTGVFEHSQTGSTDREDQEFHLIVTVRDAESSEVIDFQIGSPSGFPERE